jgi:hypothetical protein
MGPTQNVRSLRTFWVSQIKLPKPCHIAAAETFPVAQGEIPTEVVQQGRPVVGPGFSALFKLHNIVPNLPISLGDVGVDGLIGAHLPRGVNL